MTIRQKWEKYLSALFTGETELANELIQEVENALPFKDKKEHEKWLAMGENWSGEKDWLKFTEKLLKRLDKVLYKVFIPKYTKCIVNVWGRDLEYFIENDHWATIKDQENASDSYIQILAIPIMQKQIAKEIFKEERMFKKVDICKSDIQVIRI